MPGGDEQPAGAPLPLSVYQLHPLRAALYHYSRYALRPPADLYVAVSSLPRLRDGIWRSADRRFHAQPVACAECGPQLEWRGPQEHLFGEAALDATIARLLAGDIVAVKGLGGFHLLCDAGNREAVAKLRARKHRPAKPLAVMLATTAGLDEPALTLLTSPAAPIVLLEKTQVAGLCDQIAPGLAEVGGCCRLIHCSIYFRRRWRAH